MCWGNPLKYNDPSGNYSDEALKTHFDCDDWNCVEAQFEEGGQHAGCWGWLKVLMEAQDGDTIRAWGVSADNLYQETVGSFFAQNGRIMVDPSRMFMTSPSWGSPVNVSQFAGSFSEAEFAARGMGVAGMYNLSGQGNVNTAFSQRHIDCQHHRGDCIDRAVNAASMSVSVVGAGCALATAGGCVVVAGFVGGTINLVGIGRTAFDVSQGKATVTDLTVDIVTTGVDAAIPAEYGPVVSGIQWLQDER